jgi:hypothetical protein
LEEIFKYLQEHRVLPEKCDSKVGIQVKDLREKMLVHYSDEEIDWELVHDAGSTCDDSELPHHVSNDEELEVMFGRFCGFLEGLKITPVIVTVSRSTEDDYTPGEDVEKIQEFVLRTLKDKFDCSEPILDYAKDTEEITNK